MTTDLLGMFNEAFGTADTEPPQEEAEATDPVDRERMGLFASEELEERKWSLSDRSFAYWYDGIPGFAKEDLGRDKDGYERRTALLEAMFSPAPERLTEDDGTDWTLVRTYGLGAERECPSHGETHEGPERCPLCEADAGEAHGMIYIGECWLEAIYERKVEDDED